MSSLREECPDFHVRVAIELRKRLRSMCVWIQRAGREINGLKNDKEALQRVAENLTRDKMALKIRNQTLQDDNEDLLEQIEDLVDENEFLKMD